MPKQSVGKQIESLSACLKALKKCAPGYFIATARSDHLNTNPQLKRWLEQNQIKVVEIPSLTGEQINGLIDRLIQKYEFEINSETRQVLVEKSDGTLYHTILAIKFLKREGGPEITLEQARRVASLSLDQIWIEIRTQLKIIEPATGSLLEALAVFYHSNVSADRVIALAYAESLERSKRRYILPWEPKRKLGIALKLLELYGIYYRDPFIFPYVAVESLSSP
ncbi:MAG: hypothetical protein M1281_18970, partial [Chloroflexi bacterium]|nr:hypothetical protein [Chloroflexota bacterium]